MGITAVIESGTAFNVGVLLVKAGVLLSKLVLARLPWRGWLGPSPFSLPHAGACAIMGIGSIGLAPETWVALPRTVYRYYERRLARSLPRDSLPRHIGVILDGHRRFAREGGYASYQASYRAGMAKLEELLSWCSELGIKAVTAWVLSTENLRRGPEELAPYFQVLVELFERLPALSARLGFSLAVNGSLDLLPDELARAAKDAVASAGEGAAGAGSKPLRVNIALCYGGRQEIVDACRALVSDLVARGVDPRELADSIDAEGIAEHLYAADLPDTDLVIRTSGESRLSGFLLWQSAYAEFAFVDPYWPAFRRVDLLRALRDYTRRQRRFGA